MSLSDHPTRLPGILAYRYRYCTYVLIVITYKGGDSKV
jgi:hypothetical protein